MDDLSNLETRTEYRALIKTPASIYASPADRKRGYSERWTKPYENKKEVYMDDPDLRRSEETWAYLADWQERTVYMEPWKDIDGSPIRGTS